MLKYIHESTNKFMILDTQFALASAETRTIDNFEYSGATFHEHAPGTSAEVMEASLGASLDNNTTFWFTLPSLINMLGEVGFATVLELKWPPDHLYNDGNFVVHEDYVTLVAYKGGHIGNVFGIENASIKPQRVPEHPEHFFFKRPWEKPVDPRKSLAQRGAEMGRLSAPTLTTARSRLSRAVQVLLGRQS